MRILVCVKHVPDTTEVRFDPSTNELRVRQAPTKINNYDEYALEEAAQLRERLGAEVVIVCVGPVEAAKTMKSAVAAGADRAILVSGDWVSDLDAAGTAAVIAAVARKEGPFDLVLSGDVSEDNYNSLVPGLVATALEAPFVRGVSSLAIDGDVAQVERVADGFTEAYRVTLPAVLSVSSALNAPRTVTTLQVMKVPMSKVVTIGASDIGLEEAAFSPDRAATRIIGIRSASMPRRHQVISGAADEAVQALVVAMESAGVLK